MDWLYQTAYKASLVGIGFGLLIAVIKIISKVFSNASNTNFVTNKQNLNTKNYTDDSLLADAVLGNKNAQFKIGQQYWLGEERIKDARVAYAWLKIAKDSGSDASKFYLENTVYKQIDSNDANNSFKLYEDIKKAIKNKDINLCELIILKSFNDRGVGVNKKENANLARSNEIFNNKNLTFSKYERDEEEVRKINAVNGGNEYLKVEKYFLWILLLGLVVFLVNYLFSLMDEINVKKRIAETAYIEKEANKLIKYALVDCNLVDKNELTENNQLQEINVGYKKEKIELVKNSNERIVYESCIFNDEEKTCRSWDIKKTKIRFNPKQNVFTFEIFEVNDEIEKESESKIVCITKPQKEN